MGKKWLWLTIVAVVLAFVAGVVVAQDERLFPYLPQKYSESYSPTLAEWHALKLMAQLNTGSRYLSGPFIVEWCVVANPLQRPEELFLRVDMALQGTVYGGIAERPEQSEGTLAALYEALGGRQTVCEEAAARVMETVRIYFPEIEEEDVKIYFTMLGEVLGTWQGGKTTLAAEEHLRQSAPVGSAGIGVALDTGPAGVFVAFVLPGTPAAEADIRPGDVLVGVDGRCVENKAAEADIRPGDVLVTVDGRCVENKNVREELLMDVAEMIRGTEDTEVVLTLSREGRPEPFEVTLVRRQIEPPRTC